MRFDVNVLRYLSQEEFRTLTAVEMGMRNHEIVPAELIERIAGLRRGGAYKNLNTLLRHKLVHHDSTKYNGYRLTYLGYDFLAIKTLVNRGIINGVGRQIGIGKESDIYEVSTDEGEILVMKLHRLGRTSFRAVKAKRDYLHKRRAHNWLYLSRLAALKEFACMKALGDRGFPVPKAIDCNRHCVLMSLVDATPLVQVHELARPEFVFRQSLSILIRLAQVGLIHCDFNEFNLMVKSDEEVVAIDFPQMISTSHRNAKMYFDRDVECIFKFFGKRFNYAPPFPEDLVQWLRIGGEERDSRGETPSSAHQEGAVDSPLIEDSEIRPLPEQALLQEDGSAARIEGNGARSRDAASPPLPSPMEEGAPQVNEAGYSAGTWRPSFAEIVAGSCALGQGLDKELLASGFTSQNEADLDEFLEEEVDSTGVLSGEEGEEEAEEGKEVLEEDGEGEDEESEAKMEGDSEAGIGLGAVPKDQQVEDRDEVECKHTAALGSHHLLVEEEEGKSISEKENYPTISEPERTHPEGETGPLGVPTEEPRRMQRSMQKQRLRAVASVKPGGGGRGTRNASKDKAGKRSRNRSMASQGEC